MIGDVEQKNSGGARGEGGRVREVRWELQGPPVYLVSIATLSTKKKKLLRKENCLVLCAVAPELRPSKEGEVESRMAFPLKHYVRCAPGHVQILRGLEIV